MPAVFNGIKPTKKERERLNFDKLIGLVCLQIGLVQHDLAQHCFEIARFLMLAKVKKGERERGRKESIFCCLLDGIKIILTVKSIKRESGRGKSKFGQFDLLTSRPHSALATELF